MGRTGNCPVLPGPAARKRNAEKILSRQARQVQEEQDSYQSAPYSPPQFADDRDDSAYAESAPHAGPDHVDYGAYTGGYGGYGWYTDHPVFPGSGRRRRRQVPQFADDVRIQPSRFAQAARRRIQEE